MGLTTNVPMDSTTDVSMGLTTDVSKSVSTAKRILFLVQERNLSDFLLFLECRKQVA